MALETNQQQILISATHSTLLDYLFRNMSKQDGSRTCLIDGTTEKRFTYNVVKLSARRVACGLNKLGIQQGEAIMVMLENSPEFVFTFLGASLCGAITVPVNTLDEPAEIARQAKYFNVKLLVTQALYHETVKNLNVTLVFTDSAPEGHIHFSELAQTDEYEMLEVNINPDDVLWLSCRSETKEVLKCSHKELVTIAEEVRGDNPQSCINNGDVILCETPLFLFFSCIWILLCGLMARAAILLISFSSFDDTFNGLLALIEKCKVTFIPIARPIALAISKSPECRNYDLSSVKVLHLLTVQGDLLGKNRKDTLRASFPKARLIQSLISHDSTMVPRLHVPDKDILLEVAVFYLEIKHGSILWIMIASTNDGLSSRKHPLITKEGTSGVYFMYDSTGNKYVSIFKPLDEEAGAVNNPRGYNLLFQDLKKGITVGEGAFMEVVAYILDQPKSGPRLWLDGEKGFAGVPPTILVRCHYNGFNHPEGEVTDRIGSLQMFIENNGSCTDMGPSKFTVEEVHKITVLDIRLANADGHGGNILIVKDKENGQDVLIPIDHGYCLPTTFEDCTFEWLWWHQARKRYSAETTEYIKSLNAEEDIKLLKVHGWDLPVERARTLRISTMLLKKGVERGMTPHAIGRFMCREIWNKESEIERIVKEALPSVPAGAEEEILSAISNALDRRLNEIPSTS